MLECFTQVNTHAYGAVNYDDASRLRHTPRMSGTGLQTESKGRLSAADWEQAALDVLAESGVAAVAVEPLARRLGVTKGSFYWHFPNRDALLLAAIERWEKGDEADVLVPAESIADPQQRLRELIRQVSFERQSHAIFAALLKALDQPLIQPMIERVSERRLDFLSAAFRDAGHDAKAAINRARLTYTAYVGFLQLSQIGQPRMNHDEFEAYIADFIETLIPV